MALAQHAVHSLYQYRKSISTTAYTARGKNLIRCPQCLLGTQFCTCVHRRQLLTAASFCLIMYDDEVLKPTNSGRLIADLVPDTHAFIWSRTLADVAMLGLIADPRYQPYLVFPAEYALPGQQLVQRIVSATCAPDTVTEPDTDKVDVLETGKRPLLILLDGSWREAIKIFRKSPYLHSLPMLSFDAGSMAKYALRKGSRDFQFGTAEVAAMALGALGEEGNCEALGLWFDLFIESSLLGRNRRSPQTLRPITDYIDAYTLAHRDALLQSLSWQVDDS
jgi:DTW domain-containing protein